MEPVLKKRWKFRDGDMETAGRLAEALGLPEIVAQVLTSRGYDSPDEAARFLSPDLEGLHDPFLMAGMEEGVSRLVTALRREETVCVYGDYDVDGITSTALLVSFLRDTGFRVVYHIPHRTAEGYGLGREGIGRASAAGATVIVTVDCGVTALDEAEYCRSLGIDLVITDHHLPGEALPAALAVIDPLRPDCRFPFKQLAGVGVAFNLLLALRRRLREERLLPSPEPNLRRFLDLVALGTIADVVPLQGQNRILVKHGLAELSRGERTGIRALKESAGIVGEVSCGNVGFVLAPRLNACGRLDDAAPGVELLLTRDRARAASIAAALEDGNSERQEVEREILAEALDRALKAPEAGTIVLASEEWHPGVIGIVASRLVETFHRPTILISLADGKGKGSGRSIPGFHLHDALKSCSELLLRFGGHRHAAGLSIEAGALPAFTAAFEAEAARLLAPEQLVPEIAVDAAVAGNEVTLAAADALRMLAPFGAGNPEPLFVLRDAQVRERRLLRERHLKLQVGTQGRTLDAIGFDMAHRGEVGMLDLAFCLTINEWNGRKNVQLRLKDLRRAGEA